MPVEPPSCRLNRRGHAVLELGVEVFVEQVRRFHDVHVAIDKPVAIFHAFLPQLARGGNYPVDKAVLGWYAPIIKLEPGHDEPFTKPHLP
jgi:hypothetical protein